MKGSSALEEELDAWREAGRTATFWWRDDDAVDATPTLERLLALAAQHKAPLSLAVIPAHATAALAECLARSSVPLSVLQHGYDHTNHAPAGQKSMELGPDRPNVAICEELARGRAMLASLFGKQAVPVLVPPWNRIADTLIRDLGGVGFRGLSGHTARTALNPATGLVACNTHLDVLRWRPEKAFVGEEEALDRMVGHLCSRRDPAGLSRCPGRDWVDPEEPSGLLTHHLVMDEASWRFVDTLLGVIGRHPATRWVAANEAFLLSPDSRSGP